LAPEIRDHAVFGSPTHRKSVILRAGDFFDLFVFLHIQPAGFQAPDKAVILRACDFSMFFVFPLTQPAVFQVHDKALILSEALRRSIANRWLYCAKSKDLGDACWQTLLGAFRPQTTPEDKKSQTLEVVALFDFAQRGCFIDVPTAPPWPVATVPSLQLPLFLVIPSSRLACGESGKK
jgi:hypothetical protein